MKRDYSLMIITIFSIILISCDPQDGKLKLSNNTSDTIYYVLIYGNHNVEDKETFELLVTKSLNESSFILPNSIHSCVSMDPWEKTIYRGKDSTLKIIFFNKNIIARTQKDSIKEVNKYYKKVTLKVEDLDEVKWTINYP